MTAFGPRLHIVRMRLDCCVEICSIHNVQVNRVAYGRYSSKSKREAKDEAAHQALDLLMEDELRGNMLAS